jgi:hypothetical protein
MVDIIQRRRMCLTSGNSTEYFRTSVVEGFHSCGASFVSVPFVGLFFPIEPHVLFTLGRKLIKYDDLCRRSLNEPSFLNAL